MHTRVTQIISRIPFNVYSNHTTFKLQRTRIQNTQFAVYISYTHVTLKQSQVHQTYNDSVDPKEGYNRAKFETSCDNDVREKANVKVFSFFFKRGNMSIISLNMSKTRNSGIFMIYLT